MGRHKHPAVTVNGMPLAVALRKIPELRYIDDTPDDAELARTGHFDWMFAEDAFDDEAPVAISSFTNEAARALRNSERDGITKLGSRLAAQLENEVGASYARYRRRRWTRAPKPWKDHRNTQYRPVEKSRPL